MPAPYPSVVANLFDTGLHQVIFKAAFGSPQTGPLPSSRTMPVAAADFADPGSLDAMVERTKELGSLGTLVGERFSLDFFRAVCQHPSDPFKLVGFPTYEPSYEDCAVVAHGSLDGEHCVWDQLIGPNLGRLGISVDPGVVPPTPGRPDGGVLEQPTPIGTAQDPAMQALTLALDALRSLSGLRVAARGPVDIPITETLVWKEKVAPLLAGPFMSW